MRSFTLATHAKCPLLVATDWRTPFELHQRFAPHRTLVERRRSVAGDPGDWFVDDSLHATCE
jgi:hypothetical protein